MNGKYRAIVALVLLLSLTAGLFLPANAEQKGGVLINLGSHEQVIKAYLQADSGNKVIMTLYKLASPNGNGGWTADDSRLASFGLDEAELALRSDNDAKLKQILSNPDFRQIAQSLAPYKTAEMTSDYKINFSDLPSGIYYASMTKGPDELLARFLIPIPYRYMENGSEKESYVVIINDIKVNEPTEFKLTATKRMAGRSFQDGDEFTFVMQGRGNAPMPKDAVNGKVTKTIKPTGGNAAAVDFGAIEFTYDDAGKTYTYSVWEESKTEEGKELKDQYISIEQAKTVTVTVKDSGGGKLKVISSVDEKPLEFINTYTYYYTSIPLQAFKELIGREFQEKDEWTFEITPENGAPSPKTGAKVENNQVTGGEPVRKVKLTGKEAIEAAKSGKLPTVDFGTIYFTGNDIGKTYTYTIKETGTVKGVVNDPKEKTVKVEVAYNPATYELEAVSSSGSQTNNVTALTEAQAQEKAETVTFKNQYKASGSITFKGTKTVTGLSLLGRGLEPNEFAFTVVDKDQMADTATKGVIQTVYNDENGNIVFKPIQYTEQDIGKTFTYYVSEVDETIDDVIKVDDKVHNVRVTVMDGDNHDGSLKFSVTKNYKELDFTNEVETGSLLVKKMVKTPGANEEFAFTVEMSRKGSPISGDFNGVVFENGKATFKLKGNESKEIKGIPTGTEYKVTEQMTEEQQKLYVLSGTVGNASGTIDAKGASVSFTNERVTGDLTIVKKLENAAEEDADKEFTFTVTLADENVLIKGENIVFVMEDGSEKPYTGAVDKYQEVTVKTKAGVPVKIKGLPTDVEYTITEKEVPFFSLTGKTNDTGVITKDGVTAAFTNTRTVKPVSLTVTKTVEGAANDTTAFSFTVTLGDWNGGKISGVFGDMTFKDGVATFTLKHGEKKTASGLPSGISYTVTEADTTNYVMTNAAGASGTINADAALGPDRTATFINTKTAANAGGGAGGGGGVAVPAATATPAPTPDTEEETPEATPAPEPELITVEGRKTWDDQDNAAGKRPASITIHLFADSSAAMEEVASKTVTAADGWSWSFTDLPAVDSYNLPIDYSIREDPVEDYTTTYSGFNVINTMKPEVTSATVVKHWEDGDDPQHLMRPAVLKATLYGNDKAVTTVILNEGNGWRATVDDLPVYQNGSRVSYTWKEEEVLGYVQTSVTTEGDVTTFTNTLWQLAPPLRGTNPGPHAGTPEEEIDDYGTPLGLGIIINHVGDCFD